MAASLNLGRPTSANAAFTKLANMNAVMPITFGDRPCGRPGICLEGIIVK